MWISQGNHLNLPQKRIDLDLPGINARLHSLQSTRNRKPYERQKSRLQNDLEIFLASLPQPKSLLSASPSDLIHFLIWKDKFGKTKVHLDICPFFGTHSEHTCPCPTRLAAGTVDNYIAKLRSIFTSLSPTDAPNVDSSSLHIGNPATHRSVRKYLQSIREEQAQARVTPKQAVPLFFDKFSALCTSIMASLLERGISPTARYLYARDLAFFCLDFYSGDRASDLGRLKTKDVLSLPNNVGLLFRHTFGKTLRGRHTHTFAVKPCPEPRFCPVANLKLYVLLSDRMHINLRTGFLFRVTDPKGRVVNELFLSSAAANRLHKYLSRLHMDEGETVHSFRAGCSITLSILGATNEAVAKHVGWRSLPTAEYYTQTDAVMNPTKTAAMLIDNSSSSTPSHIPPVERLGAKFRARNNRDGFEFAFPDP